MRARIRALAAKQGRRIGATDLDSLGGVEAMDRLGLKGCYADHLASCRRLLLQLEDEISSIEVELDRRLKTDKRYRDLQTIKGIGPVLAAVFIAEIGDVHRFPNAAALCCWAGLTPRLHESDRTRRTGHVSKEGCKLVRWAAVEAVQRQCEPVIAAVRDDIIARRGRTARNIGKVAAARRMFEVVYYTLRDGQARCLTPAA